MWAALKHHCELAASHSGAARAKSAVPQVTFQWATSAWVTHMVRLVEAAEAAVEVVARFVHRVHLLGMASAMAQYTRPLMLRDRAEAGAVGYTAGLVDATAEAS